jgi:hypothetical protein
LKSLFSRASDRFADICWTPSEDEVESSNSDEGGTSALGNYPPYKEGVIWAHKGERMSRLMLNPTVN